MKDAKDIERDADMEYEEPVLLGAEDLRDVTGGCNDHCSNGDCSKATNPSSVSPVG